MIEGSREGERQAIEALQLGLDLGMSHIDTAEAYGHGRAEELVAEAIAGRREEVFLVSKFHPAHASFRGTLRACEQSLKRLRTEWLDLYLLHFPSPFALGETMRAMETLANEGKIRFMGVSNFGVEMLQAALRVLRSQRIACNQVLYHLGDRGIERRLLPFCVQHEIAVVGYSPFGHSDFPSPASAGGKALLRVGSHYRRTPRQVALNYLTRHPMIFSIPKAARPEHVRENLGGMGWELSNHDTWLLKQVFLTPVRDYLSR